MEECETWQFHARRLNPQVVQSLSIREVIQDIVRLHPQEAIAGNDGVRQEGDGTA